MAYMLIVPREFGATDFNLDPSECIIIPKNLSNRVTFDNIIYDDPEEALDMMEKVILRVEYIIRDLGENVLPKYKAKLLKIYKFSDEYFYYHSILNICFKGLIDLDIKTKNCMEAIDILRLNDYGIRLFKVGS